MGCNWEGVPPLIFTFSFTLTIIPFTFSEKEMRLRRHSPGLGKGCTALQMWIRDWCVDTSEKDHRCCVLCAFSHALKN